MLNLLNYCFLKMSTNWELCFLCQKTKWKDVIRRAFTSFENLIDRVKTFIQLNPTVFDLSRIDHGTGIIQKLTSNNAFYHKGCYENFSDKLLQKIGKESTKAKFRRFSLLDTNHYPQTKKNWNRKISMFVLRQPGLQDQVDCCRWISRRK